eukprot:scaffold7213_cov166-Amphora_coffeaeformis.AAC.9
MASNTFVCEDDFDCWPNGSCGGDLRCLCESGFFGEQCDEVCPLKCQNGGQCYVDDVHELINESDAYCECPSGYEGGLCERVSGALPVSNPTRQSGDNPSSNTGLITGIVAGVVAAVVVIVVAAGAKGVRRRRRKAATEKSEATSPGPEDNTLPSLA